MRARRSILINSILIGGVLVAAAMHPSSSGKLLVISPTWLGYPDALTVVAAAGGAIVGGSASNDIAVAFSDEPSFVERLYDAGALVVWSARFSIGCGNKV